MPDAGGWLPSAAMSANAPETFVVERYTSDSELSDLLGRLLAQPAGSVRHLWSLYLPAEQTLFSVYRGGSAEDIANANAAAGLAFEQVIRAVLLISPLVAEPEAGGLAAEEVST